MNKQGRIRRRLLAVVVAVAATVGVWLIAEPILGFELRAPARGGQGGTHDVSAGVVAVVSLLAALAGWALLAVLERFTTRARGLWMAAAVVVLVLSLGGPLSATFLTAANQVSLALMHLSVAATLIPLLARTSPRRASRRTSSPGVSDTSSGVVEVGR